MSIQFIDKEGKRFRLMIGKKEYTLIGINLWGDSIIPLPLKLKGSTLGWNIQSKFISYRQIKKAILTE